VAREDFDFDAGEQLNEEDKTIVMDRMRPIVIFSRVGTTVDSVGSRQPTIWSAANHANSLFEIP
jgi:hypothetical protein